MRRFLTIALSILAVAAAVIMLGPRVRIDLSASHEPTRPLAKTLEELPASLNAHERDAGELIAGTEKRIIWHAGPEQTPIALVYLHGFSATRQETAPFTENLASAIGANAFEARLAGHGGKTDVLGDATAAQWLQDTAEAITIGERIGEKVVLVGVSTGGTLAALATEVWPERVDGVILISPNFGVADATAQVLEWPWTRQILPRFMPRRSWEPSNERHGRFWTTDYRTEVLFEMQALVRASRYIDWSTRRAPALFVGSPKDDVVDFERTRAVIAQWPATLREVHEVQVPEGNSTHVVVGEILNPTLTGPLVDVAKGFIERRLGS